jgi:predicted nucleic acid-binding protein
LAIELSVPLLCDDRQAASQAKRKGVTVTGTLGVLQVAHAHDWIEIEDAIEDLRGLTDFRVPEAIVPEIIALANEMRIRVAL